MLIAINIIASIFLVIFVIYLTYGTVMMIKEAIEYSKYEKELDRKIEYYKDLQAASQGSLIPKK